MFKKLTAWLSCPKHWHHQWEQGKWFTGKTHKDPYGNKVGTYRDGKRCFRCGKIKWARRGETS